MKLEPITRTAACGLLAFAVTATAVVSTVSAEPVTRKLKRQISVMEKVIDETLLDSPNILVYSSNPSHGIYLEEFGVLFTFEASLVEKDDLDGWGNWWKNNVRIERDGGKIIIHSPDHDDDKGSDDHEKSDDAELDDEEWDSWREKRDAAESKLYERGKLELMHTLIDYGDTLTGLSDTQWVGIAAFLKNSDFFTENRISRLVLKARLGDLRAYAAGNLTEEAIKAKLVEEEY